MRWILSAGLCLWGALAAPAICAAAESPVEAQVLTLSGPAPTAAAVTSGALDQHFQTFNFRETRARGGAFWLRLAAGKALTGEVVAALSVRAGRHLHVQVFANHLGNPTLLPVAVELPEFRGVHDLVFVLPLALAAGEALYARVDAFGSGAEELSFSAAPLAETLARGAAHATPASNRRRMPTPSAT